MQNNPASTKVALITGAARRVGAEIAQTLHAAGLNVVLHYAKSEQEVTLLSDELNRKRANSATVCQADFADAKMINELISQAHAKWQRLDFLINNASQFYRTFMGSVSFAAWDELLNVNLKAPFFLAQAAAPFLKINQGAIVNILDAHADNPLKDYSAYGISKGGLKVATTVLAKELAPDIRVNGVSPGAVAWPEGENTLSETIKNQIINETLLKRSGTPLDIAKVTLFLLLQAPFITGQIIEVDGGRKIYNG